MKVDTRSGMHAREIKPCLHACTGLMPFFGADRLSQKREGRGGRVSGTRAWHEAERRVHSRGAPVAI